MNLKKNNILITGLSGFVGSHMAKYLLDESTNFLLSPRKGGWEPGATSVSMGKKARGKGTR